MSQRQHRLNQHLGIVSTGWKMKRKWKRKTRTVWILLEKFLCHPQAPLRQITFSTDFVWHHSLPRCQCRCHGTASTVRVESVESHRPLWVDQIILNYRILYILGMTLNPANRKKEKNTDWWKRTIQVQSEYFFFFLEWDFESGKSYEMCFLFSFDLLLPI